MMTSRHYTTQTFTKRVDHEGGEHHPRPAATAPSYCQECGAIYVEKHWVAKSAIHDSAKHPHWRPLQRVTCPACFQIRDGIVGGYVEIAGDFFAKHHDEIAGLIDNEAKEAGKDNPLCRIMGRHEKDGTLFVETTTEHLAQRLGHAVKKAYDGKVDYDFSHENKVLRVHWKRD
jgi:hypothetical protein